MTQGAPKLEFMAYDPNQVEFPQEIIDAVAIQTAHHHDVKEVHWSGDCNQPIVLNMVASVLSGLCEEIQECHIREIQEQTCQELEKQNLWQQTQLVARLEENAVTNQRRTFFTPEQPDPSSVIEKPSWFTQTIYDPTNGSASLPGFGPTSTPAAQSSTLSLYSVPQRPGAPLRPAGKGLAGVAASHSSHPSVHLR